MKIKSKIQVMTATTVFLAIMAASILATAGALVIDSNFIDFTPKDKPTIVLSSNSTDLAPYVGDTVQFSAVITPKPANPVTVTFQINGQAIGTAPTVNGLATYNYVVPHNGGFTGHATATIP
jgi:hypothetical protein